MISLKHVCRLCGSRNLIEYLNLGSVPVADNFTLIPQPELSLELKLNLCLTCNWSQLSNVVDPQFLYQVDYPYDSRITETGKAHWREFASSIKDRYRFPNGARCLDIGSNTGALLAEFRNFGFEVLGVDPSQVASKNAQDAGIPTLCNFFERITREDFSQMKLESSFSLITSTNSFAHVDDLENWLSNVRILLKRNGILIIEVPHILELIKSNQFDTIYHEHLSYCSLTPLIKFLKNNDFEVINVEKRSIHGGTIRIHISRKDEYDVEESVSNFLDEEMRFCLNEQSTYLEFGENVYKYRHEFRAFLEANQNSRMAIVSAPAKGVTFYHFMHLNDFSFLGISDKNHMKIGKYFPGTNIKVVSDSELRKYRPELVLILAWNFASEIKRHFNSEIDYEPRYLTAIPNLSTI